MNTQADNPETTRDRMLREARALFAARGYDGASIAQIAARLGLTKQALLHHFGTKERLYALVLEQAAAELAAVKATYFLPDDPAGALVEYLVAMLADVPQEVECARLLMRDLLDGTARGDWAGEGWLKPLLDDLMAMLLAVPGWEDVGEAERLAVVVQLLGAVSYHAVSGPAMRGAFGDDRAAAMHGVMAKTLRAQVRAVLAC